MCKAFILLLYSTLLIHLHFTGEIKRFINPSYLTLSQVASILFLFLFFIQVPRIFSTPDHDHSQCGPWGCNHGSEKIGIAFMAFIIIFIPIGSGFIIPYKDFDSAEASKRGISLMPNVHTHEGHNHKYECETTDESQIWNVWNEPYLQFTNTNFIPYLDAITQAPQSFVGKPITIEGFIKKEQKSSNMEYVLTRFIVTHCVADAHAVGIIIESGDNWNMYSNDWVRITGEINMSNIGGVLYPTIKVIKLDIIQPPKDPYIYP